MDNLLFSPAFTREAFVVLFDYALKGVVILLVANLLIHLLRPASAAIRHAIWGVALLLLMLVPLAPHVVPGLNLAILDPIDLPGGPERLRFDRVVVPDASYVLSHREEEERAVFEERVAAQMENRASVDARIVQVPGNAYLFDVAEAEALSVGGAQPAMPVLDAVILFAMTAKWSDWMLLTWLGGAVFLVGWMISGVAGLFWLRQRSMPLAGEDWQDLIDEITDRYALRRPVALMTSGRIAMPMTWGLWRPVVMLPVDAEDWPAERRRSVLLHEVAHIARWDYLTQSLAYAVCAVNWFNPLVWRAAGEMRLEQEKACDDRVLSHGMKASSYASHLMDLARTVRSTFVSPAAAMSMARPSQLEGRLMAILDDRGDRRAPSWRRLVGTAAAAFILILPLAAMQVWRPAAETVTLGAAASPFSVMAPVPRYEVAVEAAAAAEVAQHDALASLQASLEALEASNRELYFTLDSSRDTTDELRKAARRKAIAALRSALDDENEDIRRDAVIALFQIGEGEADAMDAFIDVAQNDPSVEVRRQAVQVLSRMGGAEVVNVLAEVLTSDDSRDVRIAAVQGLGMMRDIRAVDALSAAMEDEDVDVRRLAAQALSQLNYGGEEQSRHTVGRAWGGVLAPGQIRSGLGLGTTFPSADAPAVWGYSGLSDSARAMAYAADVARFGSFNVQASVINEHRGEAIQQEIESLKAAYERLKLDAGVDAQKAQLELLAHLETLKLEKQALSEELDELIESRVRMNRMPAGRVAMTTSDIEEARITELTRVVEDEPASRQCKEAYKQLEAMKETNQRARDAVETFSCEKE